MTAPDHSHNDPVCIHSMTVAYGRKPVLWDIDLNIEEGKITGVVGPNGAGKSTLLKAITDLLPRASGEVLIYGKSFRESRSAVSYVPQRGIVDWEFPVTVLDVALMGCYAELGWCRRPRAIHKDRAIEALKKVGMESFAKRHISQLSGGQQQRVFIARSLVQNAKIYLMDEPFAGVDAATERAIILLLEEMRAEGRTIVVVHHDLQTVQQYFDNLIMLNMRLVASGPVEQVFNEDNLRSTYGGRLTLLDQASHEVAKLS